MPPPLLTGFAAAAARGGLGHLGVSFANAALNSALGTMASSFLNPLTREFHYQANKAGPSIVADLPVLLGTFYAGRIDELELWNQASYLGVTLGNGFNQTPKVWRNAAELARPQFDLDDYKKWWRQGRPEVNFAKINDVLSRKGFRADRGGADEVNLFLTDRESVPVYYALQMRLLGVISDAELSRILQESGYTSAQAQLMFEGTRVAISLGDTLQLWNRGAIDENLVDENLKRLGFQEPSRRDAVKELRRVIPSPSDLITFSVKEVWDPAVVARFGYDQEFPAPFAHWMAKQGLGWGAAEVIPGVPAGQGVDWARAYWRSHWYMISPTEAADMLHRFRPDPDNPAVSVVAGVPPFTSADFAAILKIHDYPPGLRTQMEGLSYSVMRLVDIRNAYRFGVRDIAWAVGKFQDRGVTFEDARVQVELVDAGEREKELNRKRSLHRSEQHKVAAELLDQFKIGIIDEASVTQGMVDLGYFLETAIMAVARAKSEDAAETIKAVMGRAKRDFMSGRASEEQAGARMFRAGLPPAAVEKWVNRWKIERGSGRVALSTAKIIDLVKRGLLNVQQAKSYLTNLGWQDVDQVLLLAAAWQDIVKLMAAQMDAADKKRKARERELAALARASQAQTEHLQAIARRMTPLAVLKSELTKGNIGKKYYIERMLAMGYDDPYIATIYFDVFGEPINDAGNECGTYDPACGTTGETGTEEETTASEAGSGSGTVGAGALPG